MNVYNLTQAPDSLVIQRNRLVVVLGMLVTGLPFFGLFTWFCFEIFARHRHWQTIGFLTMITPLTMLVFWGKFSQLRKKVVVFDRVQNAVRISEEWKCALTDIRKVSLGKYIIPTAKMDSFTHHGLYLMLANGNAVLIEGNLGTDSFSPDVKELAQNIADFLHVPLSV